MENGSSLLARRHPRYSEYRRDWEFFLRSYLGGEAYIAENLFRHSREGAEEFEARRRRAYRENHTKKAVDLVSSYLFKEPAARSTDNPLINRFWKDFDGRGRSAGQFMKRASLFASILGRVYIVCDKRPLPEEARTGTQMDNLRSLPYCYLVYPQDVLDLSFDDRGRIRWALVRESYRDDEDPFGSSGEVEDRYRLWTTTGWSLYDEKGREIASGETGLGRVPIVTLDGEEMDEYTGQSLVRDVAYLDRSIMNNWSRLDVIVNDQTFSQLIFPVEGLPDADLGEKVITLATNRVLLYSAQAQAAPQYISPDAGQAGVILTMNEKQVKQLYASLGLQGETATETNRAASGVARAYDFEKLNKLLAGKADACEAAELEILEVFKGWMGGIAAQAKVDYPDTFDTGSMVNAIAMAQELTLLDISKTFTRELHKQIAFKVLPKCDHRVMVRIIEEIDARGDDEAAKGSVFDFDKEEGA